MTERHKKAQLTEFLKNNKGVLDEFTQSKREKYVREPWMLKSNPAAEHTMEIEVEDDQSGN
tara:strand:+ start:284 stop:466 length:183 start_codon:yes stop_codon:yes gene_type:complete